jgi:hypothetical protein
MTASMKLNKEIKDSVNDEWQNFISSSFKKNDYEIDSESDDEENISANLLEELNNFEVDNINKVNTIPKCSTIYISTKTKIAYLNKPIDLNTIFWEIPVIKYMEPKNGVIKKQMKFNSTTQIELNNIKKKLENIDHFDEQVITSINNPDGRIKFKDIRKITIGISKKDIMSYRSKKKSAFYNCFVLILRLKVENIFKEFHVKVFNTGKLEIPGIQNDIVFKKILELVLETIQPYTKDKLEYQHEKCETVLINSNFNCGFYINRDALYNILKNKYNIQTIYDSCTYPGIQCKFYFNPDVDIDKQTGCQISKENMEIYKNVKNVSFMIFRTGSVLIVGKCDENVLIVIYEFLKKILTIEFNLICQKNINCENLNENNSTEKVKDKKKKIRRKNILISVNENDH